MDLQVDWLEVDGTCLTKIDQIQPPILFSLTWGLWICVSNVTDRGLRSPIGSVGAQYRVRGINSSYAKLHNNQPQLSIEYGTGQLVSLFQCRVGLDCQLLIQHSCRLTMLLLLALIFGSSNLLNNLWEYFQQQVVTFSLQHGGNL